MWYQQKFTTEVTAKTLENRIEQFALADDAAFDIDQLFSYGGNGIAKNEIDGLLLFASQWPNSFLDVTIDFGKGPHAISIYCLPNGKFKLYDSNDREKSVDAVSLKKCKELLLEGYKEVNVKAVKTYKFYPKGTRPRVIEAPSNKNINKLSIEFIDKLLADALDYGQYNILLVLADSIFPKHGLSMRKKAALIVNILGKKINAQSENIIMLLNKSKFNINATDDLGYSLLHWGATRDDPATIHMLVKHGADVDQQDPAGFTPIHLACQMGNKEVVRALLALGANVNPQTAGGITPLALAKNNEIKEILAEALEYSIRLEKVEIGSLPEYAANQIKLGTLNNRIEQSTKTPEEKTKRLAFLQWEHQKLTSMAKMTKVEKRNTLDEIDQKAKQTFFKSN